MDPRYGIDVSRFAWCWAISLVILSGCYAPTIPAAQPSPTVDATVQSLQREIEVLRANATATSVSAGSLPTVTPTLAPTQAPEPTVAPTPVPPTAAPTLAPATAVPSPTSLSLEQAVAHVKEYTVLVGTNVGAGSGISLGSGKVITNFHVVEGANQVQVRFADNRQEPVQILRVDTRRDLALLQSGFRDTPVAAFRDPRGLQQAESLIAVGYPKPFDIGVQEPTVTRGIYSARRQVNGVWYVQTDTTLNHGNSGGPLADTQGQTVGVVRFGVPDATGLNFAIAGDEVAAFLQESASAPAQPVPTASTATKPGLGITGLTTSSVPQGQPVTLTYQIVNPGSANVPMILGASIRPVGTSRWIDDPLNDKRVDAPPGAATFSRILQVPAGASQGSYDVSWGLIGTDMQTSYGLVTKPGVLTVTGGQVAPPVATASDPRSTVTQFYDAINAKDFQTAWGLLSPRFQSTQNYSSWTSGYGQTRSAHVTDARVVDQSPGKATVSFTLMSVDDQNGKTVPKTFQGTWQLVQMDGKWRLDTPSITQVG